MSGAELQPQAIKLDKLISRVESGDIKIPAFQRGFVWNQEQVLELLDSVYRNYPVGSVLFWSSHDRLKAARNVAGFAIPERDVDYPVNYVLDGQQRLSTIYGVFCRDRTQSQGDPTYRVDAALFDIAFCFATQLFMPTSRINDAKRSIPLRVLFDTDALFPAMEGLSGDDRKSAQELYSKFSNYELPVVAISKRSKDEVGTIFERVNSTGTRLTTLDLMVAWTWSEDFHLQDEINQLLDTLDVKGFGGLSSRIVLQTLGAILQGSTTTKTILSLDPTIVRERFGEAVAAFERAIDFLSTQFKVSSIELLPHQQQVVSLAFFFSISKSATAPQIDLLSKWFWLTSFSRRYSSQTDEKMDEDIATMSEVASTEKASLGRYSHTADAKLLTRQTLTKQSPLARAYLLLLAHRCPRDLVTGALIDTGHALSSYNRKEYHHVFPKAFLKGKDVSTEKINSLSNFCFLPAASNKMVSGQAPSGYIFKLVPPQSRKEILESNILPLKMSVYQNDDYDDFLNERATLVIQYLEGVLA